MTSLQPSEIALFRGLGNTALLFMLLVRLDRPAGETELAEILNSSRNTVHAQLRSLSMLGVIARSGYRNGWILTVAGRQMVLGTDQPAALPEPEDGAKEIEEIAESDCENELRKICAFEPPITTINTSSELKEDLIVVVRKESSQLRKNCAFEPPECPENPPSQDENPELLKIFQKAGITLNRRTRKLLEKPYISADYIWAHYLALKAKGKAGETGLLITILESGAPAPEQSADPQKDYQRYLGGEFSEFIKH